MPWQQMIDENTWQRKNTSNAFNAPEDKRTWSRGHGYWETAGKWSAGGILEFRIQGANCFARVDFRFERRITQYYVIFPIDFYSDAFMSNNRLEGEIIEGIELFAKKQ